MKNGAVKSKEAGGGERQTPNAKRQTPNGMAAAPVYDLGERLLQYSARIIRLMDSLFDSRAGNHIGGQLLRSGTSPLAAHGEAQAAESIDDFIHKLKIALKELQESWRWLRLIHVTPLMAKPSLLEPLLRETEELVRIFSKSVRSAESNRDSRVQEDPHDDDTAWLAHPPLAFGVWRLAFEVTPTNAPRRTTAPTSRPRRPRK